jgi:hypothetical protein
MDWGLVVICTNGRCKMEMTSLREAQSWIERANYNSFLSQISIVVVRVIVIAALIPTS